MYKMLIVDDERFMITYLKGCVDWKKHSVHIVATAHNGVDAIQKTAEFQPDIIITDIVMPEMQGLEFIKNIYSTYKNTKIIVLSGHQNFKFAKEAMIYGVTAYLVKPSLPEEIELSVLKAIESISNKRTEQENYKKALNDLKNSIPDIKKSFIDLLMNEPKEDFEKSIYEKIEILNIKQKKYITPIKLVFGGLSDVMQENEENSAFYALEALFCKRLEATTVFAGFIGGFYGVLYSDNIVNVQVIELVRQYALEHSASYCVTACAALSCDSEGKAFEGFNEIKQVLHLRPCSNKAFIFGVWERQNLITSSLHRELNFEILLSAIRAQDSKLTVKEIDNLLSQAIENQNSMRELRHCLRHLLKALDDLLLSSSVSLTNILPAAYINKSDFQQLENLNEIKQLLVAMSSETISVLKTECSEPYPKIVAMAIKYIRIHFKENITVAELAEHLYLTPNYLSAIYKKATGTSISEYITICRINEAKALLQSNCDLKNYEVADLVGYSDYEHFRKVFKKHVGVNPAKYKTEMP